MKIIKSVIIVFFCYLTIIGYSQSDVKSSFSTDITNNDVKTVLKTVADWQIKTPLTHNLADWTNAALYAGMVEWAGIADNESYYEWLRTISEKNNWDYYKHENQIKTHKLPSYPL